MIVLMYSTTPGGERKICGYMLPQDGGCHATKCKPITNSILLLDTWHPLWLYVATDFGLVLLFIKILI